MRHIFKGSAYSITQSGIGPIMYPTNDYYVGRSIALTGEYGWHEYELMRKVLNERAAKFGRKVNFVEGGANIGFFSVALALGVPEIGEVHAFEPQPCMFQCLCANIAMNDLTHVVFPSREALTSGAGKAFCYIPLADLKQTTNFSAFSLHNYSRTGIKTAQVQLDAKIHFGCNIPIDLIKLDIEGYELEALQGGNMLIETDKPVLYLENNQKGRQGSLIRWLKELGYICYWHIPPMFREDNPFKQPTSPWGANPHSWNMLCFHQESPLGNVVDYLGESPEFADCDPEGEDAFSVSMLTGKRSFVPGTGDIPAHGIYVSQR